MKVNDICKVGFSRPVFNDVIDGRGFVKTPPYQLKPSNSRELKVRFKKLGSKPLRNAQTAPSSVSGQVKTPCNVGREWKPINTRNLEWKNF